MPSQLGPNPVLEGQVFESPGNGKTSLPSDDRGTRQTEDIEGKALLQVTSYALEDGQIRRLQGARPREHRDVVVALGWEDGGVRLHATKPLLVSLEQGRDGEINPKTGKHPGGKSHRQEHGGTDRPPPPPEDIAQTPHSGSLADDGV